MRRPGGIVPPGKAGLLMIAFALIPIVLKEARPLVKAAGKGLRRLGEAVERVADSSQIDVEPKPTRANPSPSDEHQPSEPFQSRGKSKSGDA